MDELTEKRRRIVQNIKSCDPLTAQLLRELYDALLDVHPLKWTMLESFLVKTIEQHFESSEVIYKREVTNILSSVNEIIRKTKKGTTNEAENAFYRSLEEIVFVRLLESPDADKDAMSQIEQYIQRLLKLDYDQSLPTFEIANEKRNIFNYIALSLDTISQKFQSSTVSTKAVNNLMSHFDEAVFVITDSNWNIRFVNSSGEHFFQQEHASLVGQNLSNYIYELDDLNREEFYRKGVFKWKVKVINNLKQHEFSTAYLTAIPPNTSSFTNGEQDEVEEFVIRLDLDQRDEKLIQQQVQYETMESVENVITGLHTLKENTQEKDTYLKCLENLYRLKQRLYRDMENEPRGKLQKQPVNFEAIIHAVWSDLCFYPGIDEILLSVKVQKPGPFKANADLITSVIKNLLSNAIKYRDPNKSHSQVEVTLGGIPGATLIMVSDNGIGINSQYHKLIFEEGFQLRKDDNTIGYGKGLYLSRSLLAMHGGMIEVESTIGQGTLFSIILPD